MRGFKTAISTLTIIPVGEGQKRYFKESLYWFPVIGLLIGGGLAGLWRLWSVLDIDFNIGLAGLILLFQLILTGCLHMDGLADFVDALGSRQGREGRLIIMKDPHIGTFGVSAIVMDLMLKLIFVHQLINQNNILLFVHIMVISRSMMVELISTLPYARGEQGTGWPFVSSSTTKARFISLIITVLIIFVIGGGIFSVALLLSALLFTWILSKIYLRLFGGITGDLMGASNEMIEIMLMFICAISGTIYGSAL